MAFAQDSLRREAEKAEDLEEAEQAGFDDM